MSGPSGTWQTTSGGAVLSAGGVAVLAAAVVAFTERHAIGQVLGAVAVVAYALIAAAVVAVPVGLVFLVRYNRRQGVMLTARRAEMAAVEEARVARRRAVAHQRALEVAAASAPVIHNNVWTREAIEAMRQAHTPTVIVADAEEITR